MNEKVKNIIIIIVCIILVGFDIFALSLKPKSQEDTKEEVKEMDKDIGRPSIDNPTNENTIKSKTNGSNNAPKPSITK